MKSDGTTQLVEGVTCNIRKFVELAKECIDNSKAGFDKKRYFEALGNIVSRVKGKTAEDLGIVNEDGYIVISFQNDPDVYTLTKTDSEGNKKAYAVIGVRQIEAGYQKQQEEGQDDKDPQDKEDKKPEDQDKDTEKTNPTGNESAVNLDPGEDGKNDDNDKSDLVGSIDDLPIAEISTFVEAPPGFYREVRTVVTSLNTCYKFLKDYLNWLV